MRNTLLFTITLVLAFSMSACGKKKTADKKPSEANNAAMKAPGTPTEPAMAPEKTTGPEVKGGGAVCAVPEDNLIVKDTTFPKGCKLTVEQNLEVDEGATLTIEAGARLAFKVDTGLHIKNGKLVARGTAAEPIVLTSANTTTAPGDWNGVVFDEEHLVGQVLEFVTIEFAGHENYTGLQGGIIVYASQGDSRITLTSCTIRQNAKQGIINLQEKGAFVKIESTTFEKNGGTAMNVLAQLMGQVADSNKFDEKIIISGKIHRSVTFPKLAIPFFVDGSIDIGDDENPPTLTLPEGTVLRFKAETGIFVASESAGALVARKVTFTSNLPTPKAGDWYGITLHEKTTGTSLEECVIEFAGQAGPIGNGALVVEGDSVIPKNAKATKLSIKSAETAWSGPAAACEELAKAEHGNTVDGKPFTCPKEE
ncbi:hypothetical protein KJ975_13435 [Myxococcota bacterium]|nr:hypothetical protein [Myxococcota bacterium]